MGILTGNSNRGLNLQRLITAVLSFIGNLPPIRSGVMLANGLITKLSEFGRLCSGVLSFVGTIAYDVVEAGGDLFDGAADGVLTIAGAILRLVEKIRTYSSSLTFSGIISSFMELLRTLSGSVTSSGVASRLKEVARTYSGILNLSGDITNDGTPPPVIIPYLIGSLSRLLKFIRQPTANLTFEGVLTYLKKFPTLATLTVSGELSYVLERVQRFLSETRQSTQDFIGELSYVVETVFQYLTYTATGALTFLGSMTRIIDAQRAKSGILSFSGMVRTFITGPGYASTSGTVSFKGWLAYIDYVLHRAISGSLTLSGTISYLKYITGRYTAVGSQTFEGILTYISAIPLPYPFGAISSSGSISKLKEFLRNCSGRIGIPDSGAGTWTLSGIVSGMLTWDASGYIASADGIISFAGAFLRSLVTPRSKAGTISFSSSLNVEREILYYGVANP